MYPRLKTAALSTLLMAPASVHAIAQNADPTQSTPSGGVGAWITGHPMTDTIVVLAIIVVIAGTYFMRSRA